jgi:hypothetical protein
MGGNVKDHEIAAEAAEAAETAERQRQQTCRSAFPGGSCHSTDKVLTYLEYRGHEAYSRGESSAEACQASPPSASG